jgi:hypothetical protein
MEIVPVGQKDFIGIGKIVFDSNAEWNIPHLHFMVDKTASGNYEATLLEFGLVSWSESDDEAIKSLIKQTHFYILSVMEKSGFDQFIKEADNHVMDDYWRHYRKIEFSLARYGRDLSHKMDSILVRAIKNMLSEETMKIIRETAKNNAEEVMREVKKILSLTPSTLTYTEVKEAA